MLRGHWASNGFHYDSVVVMRTDGSHKRTVFAPDRLSSWDPAWSPDGRWIAFNHTDIGGTGADPNIYIVSAAGGEARLVTDVGSQEHPDWSPDSSLIAYTFGLELGPDDIRVVRRIEPATRRSPTTSRSPTAGPPGRRAASAWQSRDSATSGPSRPMGAGCAR